LMFPFLLADSRSMRRPNFVSIPPVLRMGHAR
jgi:hypothetical protein